MVVESQPIIVKVEGEIQPCDIILVFLLCPQILLNTTPLDVQVCQRSSTSRRTGMYQEELLSLCPARQLDRRTRSRSAGSGMDCMLVTSRNPPATTPGQVRVQSLPSFPFCFLPPHTLTCSSVFCSVRAILFLPLVVLPLYVVASFSRLLFLVVIFLARRQGE